MFIAYCKETDTLEIRDGHAYVCSCFYVSSVSLTSSLNESLPLFLRGSKIYHGCNRREITTFITYLCDA